MMNVMNEWRAPAGLRAILFDKDGTILDFERTWGPVNRQAARLAAAGDDALQARLLVACGIDSVTGKTRPDSFFAAANTAEIARHMVTLGSPLDADQLTRDMDAIYQKAAHDVVPLVDVQALFSDLAASGFVLGIATSDSEASARIAASALGIEDHLAFICGYDSGHGAKPEPGMVHGFCDATGCAAGEVAMVGDNAHDMQMGRSAKAGATIGVLSGTGRRESLAPFADVCLPDIAALPQVLS